MELALTYAVMDAQRRDDYHREQQLLGIDGGWRAFHASEEHKVSVLAGRRTGKTTNIALRAFLTRNSCEVFTPHMPEVQILLHEISRLAEERDVDIVTSMDGNRHARVQFDNGKEISIYSIRNSDAPLHGRRWAGKEIFFSEFDHSYFSSIMHAMALEIQHAYRIYCVGSMASYEDDFAKRWFKESDIHYFIDSDRIPPTRGHMRWEYQPSIARSFIEHLPPLSFDYD